MDLKKADLDKPVDQFTMAIDSEASGGGVIKMQWEKTQYSVAFTVKSEAERPQDAAYYHRGPTVGPRWTSQLRGLPCAHHDASTGPTGPVAWLVAFVLAGAALAGPVSRGWAAEPMTPQDSLRALRAFRELGSVLYVAAHPDDENTQLVAYLARGRGYRTAYLSLTRGDGGQNVIGPEIFEELGVIRTQELLAARRLDGGRQFFTRAIDFGFSKNPTETLRIWDRTPPSCPTSCVSFARSNPT